MAITSLNPLVQAEPVLNLAITACDGSGGGNVTVAPGCAVTYAVTGELSDTGSRGLAGFGFDLVFGGGALEPARVPEEPPMTAFCIPLGINNGVFGRAEATAFGGTRVRGKLRQCGGVMNTLGDGVETVSLPFPTGSPVEGVAQAGSPQVLLRGSVMAPATEGTYTLAISATCVNEANPSASSDARCASDADCGGGEVCRGHPFASVINSEQSHGGSHLDVLAAPVKVAGALTINVAAGGTWPCARPLPAPYPHNRAKNRYISFATDKATNDGRNIAFEVTLTSLTLGSCSGNGTPCRLDRGNDDCGACSVTGEPCITMGNCRPSGQSCNPTGESCVNDHGGSVGRTWWVGEGSPLGNDVHPLVSEPFRAVSENWAAVVHVGDCEIVPVATYAVRAVDTATGAASAELLVRTIDRPGDWYWADCVSNLNDYCTGNWAACPNGDGDCPPGQTCVRQWGPPNGYTNFDEVTAGVMAFQRVPGTSWPHVTVMDIHGDELFGEESSAAASPPNYVINMTDVQFVVLAFVGRPYPFYDPADCPDTGVSGLGGGGSMPEGEIMGGGMYGPLTSAGFSLVPSTDLVHPNEAVDVEVFTDSVENLGAYQVTVEVTGGTVGSLQLEAVAIDTGRQDYVFSGASASTGTSLVGASLGAVLMNPGGWVFEGPAYLGTFTYRASADAAGVFTVSVRPELASFLNDAAGSVIEAGTEATALVGCGVECMTDGHCDDADECTIDTCVANVCTFNPGPAGVTCDDGKFCTVGEECDGAGACAGGTSPCQPGEKCCELWNDCRTGSCALPPQ